MAHTRIRESNEWITLRWHDEDDVKTEQLPRVLLIGDSIVNGHGSIVSQKLKGHCGVDCFCTSKIVCDVDFMPDLQIMFDKHRYDAIVFNNGLHGELVRDEDYVSGLRDVLPVLQNLTGHLVWRNSTPCYAHGERLVNPWTKRIEIRNQIAGQVVSELGLPSIDCYSALQGRPELITDGVHFSAKGYEEIADMVCAYLNNVMPWLC